MATREQIMATHRQEVIRDLRAVLRYYGSHAVSDPDGAMRKRLRDEIRRLEAVDEGKAAS